MLASSHDPMFCFVGTYYILLYGYASYSGVTLKASLGIPLPTFTVLRLGVPALSLNLTKKGSMYFRLQLNVPPSGTLVIRTCCGTGDTDLYIKKGTKPTKRVYDKTSHTSGNNDTVTFTDPTTGMHAHILYIFLLVITVEHTYDACPKYSELGSFRIIAYLYVSSSSCR